MISASRCKLLSKGAGACARAGSHERLRPTKPTMRKYRNMLDYDSQWLIGRQLFYGSTRPKQGDIAPSLQQFNRRRHDCGKARCRRQALDDVRCDPACFAEFLIADRFARNPARRERQDHEMAFDAVVPVAGDGFAKPRKRDRLDGAAGFLADFARHGFVQGFTRLDDAAWQAEEPV